MSKKIAVLEIKQIISKFKKDSIVYIEEVNVNQYLDYLETIFSSFIWSESSWADRIKMLFTIGDVTIEFYKDIIDETVEDQEKALIEISKIGWQFIKEKFNIKFPFMLSMIEGMIIEIIISAAVKFALLKFPQKIEND